MVEIQWHSQTKERATANTNFNLHRRASPRPYLRGTLGETPEVYSPTWSPRPTSPTLHEPEGCSFTHRPPRFEPSLVQC